MPRVAHWNAQKIREHHHISILAKIGGHCRLMWKGVLSIGWRVIFLLRVPRSEVTCVLISVTQCLLRGTSPGMYREDESFAIVSIAIQYPVLRNVVMELFLESKERIAVYHKYSNILDR